MGEGAEMGRLQMANGKHQSAVARHSSATTEHFTPKPIVDAARKVLRRIDIDPASTREANRLIGATRIYTKKDNGYLEEWKGNVFLNPPGGWCDVYGQQVIKASGATPGCTETGACGLKPGHTHGGIDSSQKRWWQKLALAWQEGDVDAAIFVCFSVELLQSSQVDQRGRLPLEFPICYPSRRVAYLRADGSVGKSPPHASCIIFLPRQGMPDPVNFAKAFTPLGAVVVPWGAWAGVPCPKWRRA